MRGAYMKPVYAFDINTLYMHSMCTCHKCIQHTRSTYAQFVQHRCVHGAYALSVCTARASPVGGAQHLRYRGIARLPDEHRGHTAVCRQGTWAILWKVRTTCAFYICALHDVGTSIQCVSYTNIIPFFDIVCIVHMQFIRAIVICKRYVHDVHATYTCTRRVHSLYAPMWCGPIH